MSPIDTLVLDGAFAIASSADADDAVTSAAAAQRRWATTSWRTRVELLNRAADLMSECSVRNGAALAWEKGELRLEAISEVEEAADLIRYYTHAMVEHGGFELSMLRFNDSGAGPARLRWFGAAPVDATRGLATSPTTCALADALGLKRLHLVGHSLGVDVALRDPATGQLIEGSARGELVVRGPNVFAGYWRDPEGTERAFADGWLLTGDGAGRDEQGNYRIVDRIKDMFVTGGENVYPAEVEGALAEHESVADAAVVGVADPRWGEVGVAFVVPAPDARPSQAALRSRLAGFKVPRALQVVDELPRSEVGKVLKDELRRRARS